MKHLPRSILMLLALAVLALVATQPAAVSGAGTTYFVSSSGGSDLNDGLSQSAPFRTIAKVNGLALQAGDQVLFKCGDTWRGEILRITASGSAASYITYNSYPAGCANQPVLSGAQPITGWTQYSGNTYVADLSAGANAANFPPATTAGINQLFRNGQRLAVGRWPDVNASDGGYAAIASQPAGTQIKVTGLPAGSWSGAGVHVRAFRYVTLNRIITASSSGTLTLNASVSCESGCAGWGVWLDNSLLALNQDGEWFYDSAANKVYLYSASGSPNSQLIEGSVVIKAESGQLGGIILGTQLQQSVAHIIIDNFDIEDWFANGITTPLNYSSDDDLDVIIRNNVIRDVDDTGIVLSSYVWNAAQAGNGYNGWRGGRNMQVLSNTVDGANHVGISSAARQSIFQDNVIRNVGLMQNLGPSGLGCGTTGSAGGCIEQGDAMKFSADQDGTYSSNNLTVQHNRIELVGYNGILASGYSNLFDSNVILGPCQSLSDCAGVNGYGSTSMQATHTHDVTVTNNIIVDAQSNTNGSASKDRALLAVGIEYQVYLRNMTTSGNTVIHSVFDGIRYQDATGAIQNNTLYNNVSGSLWGNEIAIVKADSHVSALTGNVIVQLNNTGGTLAIDSLSQLSTSDNNHFYDADVTRRTHIVVSGALKTLAQWRTYSGKDAHSTEMISSALNSSQIFYNDTKAPKTFTLSGDYTDLNGNPVSGSLTLQPFTSEILLPAGPNPTPTPTSPPPVGSQNFYLPLIVR